MIGVDRWILLPENIGSDTWLHRMSISSVKKQIGFDQFLSNPIIGFYRDLLVLIGSFQQGKEDYSGFYISFGRISSESSPYRNTNIHIFQWNSIILEHAPAQIERPIELIWTSCRKNLKKQVYRVLKLKINHKRHQKHHFLITERICIKSTSEHTYVR